MSEYRGIEIGMNGHWDVNRWNRWGVVAEWIRAPNSSSATSVQFESPSFCGPEFNYNCFSPPMGKWVPVRAEMVLVMMV